MFVLIVGGGKVGTYLARALLAQDHEVVVIEKVAAKAQRMANLLENDVTMVGDGCDPLVLEQAGIKRADVVVADTGDDEDNLVVCLIAKKHSKARCIARVNNPNNKLIFESIDRERPIVLISSTEIILDVLNEHVNAASYRAALETMHLFGTGNLSLVRMTVRPDSSVADKHLAELTLPRNSVIVAIEREPESEMIIPTGDTQLRPG
ncbi:MAG: NAD-binding protein, partial [Candidatus Eremiobacteraeota bacterium]|nr:NAD-binding protein [Candidatus Eremiobacteraeota bacterium]